MSTRSAIAYASGDGWHGVYCHSDGDPTGQGPQVWNAVQHACGGNARRFRDTFIARHPAGWSSFSGNKDGWCYCHDHETGKRTSRRDNAPMPVCSDHEADNSALFIEWVYVVGTNALTVYTSIRGNGETVEADPRYVWGLVGTYPLDAPEPDWEGVEACGDALKDAAHACNDIA